MHDTRNTEICDDADAMRATGSTAYDAAQLNDDDSLGLNTWLVDEMRARWQSDPASVDASWLALFEGSSTRSNGSSGSDATETTVVPASAVPTPLAPASAGGAEWSSLSSIPKPSRPYRPAAYAPPRTLAAADSMPGDSPANPRTPLHPQTPDGGPAENAANRTAAIAATAAPSVAAPKTRIATPAPAMPTDTDTPVSPIRGIGARIAENMEASLAVPTATSFKDIPAKLLEVNRKIINGHLQRKAAGRISFTHLIGYAVVRAIADSAPVMNHTFATDADGRPFVVSNKHINLGLAVDLPKSDGSRTLLVPVIHAADTLDFQTFVQRYNEQIDKARTGRLTIDDFADTTVTLTNPGILGTQQSLPRLMIGQGTIIGIGTLAFPAEFEATDPNKLAELGVSKLVTVSSTYDHRVIQGAESGMFLKQVHSLLLGSDSFYSSVFRALNIPYKAVKWRRDFNPIDRETVMLEKQSKVNDLINQYRVRGHLIADLDPLRVKEPEMHPELDPASYGLTIWDLDRQFLTGSETSIYAPVGGTRRMALGDLLGVLRDAYCRTVGVEYMHMQEPAEKRWMQEQIEGVDTTMAPEDQHHILGRLNAAEALFSFLAAKYVGQKRFGLEGAESAIPLIDGVLSAAADAGLTSAVMGMAHRGRLNVLVNVVGKSYRQLFSEFEGAVTEAQLMGSGDVIYHLGQHGIFTSPSGNQIEVELAANPSHLEAIDPVVVGMARARMDAIDPDADYSPYPVLPVLVHGDAAFAGQGVVAETLNISQIMGYRVGGTIHVVINNQLGFTTTPASARSTEYCTDVAKMISAPIFHVNGDDPEACVRVARLALAYRQKFNKDAVIDLICYRRLGHNEGDDPSYTLPEMYRRINKKPTVREQYTTALVKRGDLTAEEQAAALEDYRTRLQAALDETRDQAPSSEVRAQRLPEPVGVLPHVHTAIDAASVDRIYGALTTVPEGFCVHPKLARQFKQRDQMFQEGWIDWALGEAMAFGSMLMEGTPLRLSGQDSRRGTFSHRHSTLVDYNTSEEYVPLSALCSKDAGLWIYDSLLSEYAALGFEYGYAVAKPEALVMWEAQFGDFANGAQIVIDQFLVAAEDKWNQSCGLVLLLPHGLEGQGPEHSSARVERFMTLAANDNIQVCNPTTAAQYFHLLRRQVMHREAYRTSKPLIVFTPKSLLRARTSRSRTTDLMSGTFQEALPDPALMDGTLDPKDVDRVVFCSGKVAYDAMKLRDEHRVPVAICRIEQLYPWPYAAVKHMLQKYSESQEIVWLQEESENMGPWNSVKGRLYEAHEDTHKIRRVSRVESGSPACGSARVHGQEQEDLLNEGVLG